MGLTGIAVSTPLEADILIESLFGTERMDFQGKAFYRGSLKNRIPVIICICGVGKANAAHGTTLLIERFHPGRVYSVGVAGAYPSAGLAIGDIVVAEREIYADEGLLLDHCFNTMEALQLPLASVDGTAYYNEFPLTIPSSLINYASKGAFVTVSTCTGTLARGKELEERYNALCENMEGAAVVQICLLNGIPVSEIRGISNIIEDRVAGPLNKEDLQKAAETLQRFMLIEVL
jgi:futalosine hydrolase